MRLRHAARLFGLRALLAQARGGARLRLEQLRLELRHLRPQRLEDARLLRRREGLRREPMDAADTAADGVSGAAVSVGRGTTVRGGVLSVEQLALEALCCRLGRGELAPRRLQLVLQRCALATRRLELRGAAGEPLRLLQEAGARELERGGARGTRGLLVRELRLQLHCLVLKPLARLLGQPARREDRRLVLELRHLVARGAERRAQRLELLLARSHPSFEGAHAALQHLLPRLRRDVRPLATRGRCRCLRLSRVLLSKLLWGEQAGGGEPAAIGAVLRVRCRALGLGRVHLLAHRGGDRALQSKLILVAKQFCLRIREPLVDRVLESEALILVGRATFGERLVRTQRTDQRNALLCISLRLRLECGGQRCRLGERRLAFLELRAGAREGGLKDLVFHRRTATHTSPTRPLSGCFRKTSHDSAQL